MSKRNIFLAAKIFFVMLLCLMAITMVVSCGDDEEAACDGNHVWDGGKVTNATCTVDGSKVFTCTKCGETKKEVIKASHDYKETVTNATCTLDGSVTKACTKCGDSTTNIIKASHNYVTTTVEVTCTRNGAIVNTCSGCGDTYRTVTELAKGHNTLGAEWTSSEVRVSEEGCDWMHIETTNCKDCGEEVSHTSNYVKHDFYVSISQTASCSTKGVKTKTCKDCKYSEDEEYSDENAHTWDEGTVSANVTTYNCVNGCGETKSVFSAKEEISAQVPSDALQSAGEVELLNASVKLDQSVLDQLQGADVTISAQTLEDELLNAVLDKMSEEDKAKLGSGAIFNFSLSQNGDLIGEFNGNVTVTVPFTLEDGMDPDNIAIWYIDEDGNPATYEATYCEINGQGYAKFETNHFSYYTVIRMSPSERCEFYGHKYETTVVSPICNEQGYKMDVCKMCKDIKRYDFTPALTHNYTSSVTAPSCSDRGYTTYVCSNCSDRYVSDYVEKTEHTFVTSVVASTCDKKGYTLDKCSACNYSYTSKETAALGHTYQNGVCTVCNKVLNTSGNTFLTMIDSMGKADSYLIKSNGLKITVTQGHEDNNSTLSYVIENLQATVTVDENGMFSGKGEIVISVDNDMGMSEMSGKMNAIAIFADGMFNVYVNADAGMIDEEASKLLMSVKQEYLLEEMFGGSTSVEFDASILEAYAPVWESILNKENNPVNQLLAKIIGFAFTQKETADGYTYIFNPTIATVMYNSLKTDSVYVIFEKIFGEGTFDSTVAFLKDALGMTFAQLEVEGAEKLAKLGINLSDIFTVPEEMKDVVVYDYIVSMVVNGNQGPSNGTTEGDSSSSGSDSGSNSGSNSGNYGEIATKPLSTTEKVEDSSSEENSVPTLDELKSKIDEMANMLKQATVFDIFGTTAPEGEDPILTMIQSIVDSFAKANLQFVTNKDGEYISSSATFNNFVYNFVQGEMNITVALDGSISLSANETYATDYSDILNQIGALNSALTPDSVVDMEYYYIIPGTDCAFIWSNIISYENDFYIYNTTQFINPTLIGEEMYDGKLCQKYEGQIVYLYLIDSAFVNGSVDCVGWNGIHVELSGNGSPVNATVWMDENEKVVGLDLGNNDLSAFNSYSSMKFFYNISANEYSVESKHSYKLVQTIQPNGCEYGKRIYECTVCGNTKTEEFGEGHNWSYEGKLNEGATSCEDGATVTRFCTKCNQISSSYNVFEHNTFSMTHIIETDSECGKVIINYSSCACGERQYFNSVDGDHVFGRLDDQWIDGKWTYSYRCGINNCGYTYTCTESSGYNYDPNREETCLYTSTRYYSFDGDSLTFTINNSWASHPCEREDLENGYIEHCTQCGRSVNECHYDSYDRIIYQFNYIENYGWERTYNGCDYVERGLGNNEGYEHSDTNHMFGSSYYNDTCSQYYLVTSQCRVCGFVDESEYRGPDDYYGNYDTHNWYMEDNVYVCHYCGTKSALGVNGLIVLEDMTDTGEFKVGYFNKLDVDMETMVYFNLILNYTEEGDGIEVENYEDYLEIVNTTPSELYGSRESGIVTVDNDALFNYISSLDETVETVSLVCWVLNESEVNFDEEGNPIEFWLAHALTFDVSELKNLQ